MSQYIVRMPTLLKSLSEHNYDFLEIDFCVIKQKVKRCKTHDDHKKLWEMTQIRGLILVIISIQAKNEKIIKRRIKTFFM